MADKDIGSLVVMAHGELVGMLTFREVIPAIVQNGSRRQHAGANGDGRLRRSPARPKPKSTKCAA